MKVPEELLKELLPGPVTLVMERSEELNKDLNPFTPVSQVFSFSSYLAFSGIQNKPVPYLFQPIPYNLLSPWPQLVGVRIPDHAFMQELAQMFEGPLALTSANISSQASSLKVEVSLSALP